MPGPDYPFAVYIDGCPHTNRPPLRRPRSVILHARWWPDVPTIAHHVAKPDQCPHYVICPTGCVLQCSPERHMTHMLGPARRAAWSDPCAIHYVIIGRPEQTTWPPIQVSTVAHVFTISRCGQGELPMIDAANAARDPVRFPRIVAWPWLEMYSQTLRRGSPIERLRAAIASGTAGDKRETDEILERYFPTNDRPA